MAASITLKSASYDGRYLQLTCTQTKNIANNTSTISWTLSAIGGNSNYYSTGATSVYINGTRVYYKDRVSYTTQAFPAAKGSTSGTLTVNHNTDGTKAIAVSLSTAIYTAGIGTKSDNWTLDAIPRFATISSGADFEDTVNPVLGYTNSAGSAVTTLQACIATSDILKTGDICGYRDITKTGSSYTFTLTDTEKQNIINYCNNNNTIEFSVYYVVKTTIGDTTNYETKKATCKLTDAMPTMSVNITNLDEAIIAITGSADTWVKNLSNISYYVDAAATKGATIKNCTVTCGSYTNSNGEMDGVINGVDSGSISVSITDSRNKTVEQRFTYSLIDYIVPTCTVTAKAELVDETQAQIKVTAKGNFYNGTINSNVNADSLWCLYYYKKSTDTDYSTVSYTTTAPAVSGNSYSISFTIPTLLPYEDTYQVKVGVVDLFHNTDYESYAEPIISAPVTVKAAPVFDWSETDFNFNVPVKFNGVQMQDYIVEQGTYNGWYFRKWDSGTMECWRRLQLTATVTTSWGGLYTSGALSSTNLTYPYSFTDVPQLTVNLMPFGSGGFLMTAGGNYFGSETQTGALEIARGTAASGAGYLINYYAIGRYK